MKYFIITVLTLVLLSIAVLAQTSETENYEKVVKRLIEAYNKGEYAKMEADYSEDMLKDFPLDKSKSLFETLKTNYGTIKKFDPPVFPAKSQAIFTTYFEKGILDIVLALNDKNKIIGLIFMEHPKTIPALERNKTLLSLPFKGQWLTVCGGDTKEQNIYHDLQNQKFSFDFVIIDDKGLTHKDLGDKNEDYYAFNQEVYAPANGIITDVIDGVRDNVPGSQNFYSALGNAVFIQHSDNEISVFSHLKMGSIKVKAGDKIKTGQILGLCGNSGNSSEPNIHYHLQNTPIIQDATGIKCYFQTLFLVKKDKKEMKVNYSPVKGEVINSN